MPEPSTPRSILVVDDDEDIRDSLRQVLEFEGYEVAVAADGLNALEILSKAKPVPGLILLDLMMPQMNAWEFNEERKLEPKFASIPVVVITASSHAEVAAKPISPAAVLRKPIDLSTLLETVKRYHS